MPIRESEIDDNLLIAWGLSLFIQPESRRLYILDFAAKDGCAYWALVDFPSKTILHWLGLALDSNGNRAQPVLTPEVRSMLKQDMTYETDGGAK